MVYFLSFFLSLISTFAADLHIPTDPRHPEITAAPEETPNLVDPQKALTIFHQYYGLQEDADPEAFRALRSSNRYYRGLVDGTIDAKETRPTFATPSHIPASQITELVSGTQSLCVVEERPENLTNPMTVKCFWDNLEPHKFPLEERAVPAILRAQKVLKIAMYDNTACVVHQSLDDEDLPRRLTCWDVYQDPMDARIATREIPPSHLAANAPLTQFYVLDTADFFCVLVFCDSDLLIGGSTGRHFTVEEMQENIVIPKAIAVQYLSGTPSIEDKLREMPSSFNQVYLPDDRDPAFRLKRYETINSYLTDSSNNVRGQFSAESRQYPGTQENSRAHYREHNPTDTIFDTPAPIHFFLGGLSVGVFIGQAQRSLEEPALASVPIATLTMMLNGRWASHDSIKVPSHYTDSILYSLHERVHGFTLFMKKSLPNGDYWAALDHFLTRPVGFNLQRHFWSCYDYRPLDPILITTQVDNLKFFSSALSTPRTYTLKPSGQLVLSDFDVEILQIIQLRFCNTWILDQNEPILIRLKDKGQELYGKIFEGTVQRILPSIYKRKCDQTLLKSGIKEAPSNESLKLYKSAATFKAQKAETKGIAGRILSFINYILHKSAQVIRNFFSDLIAAFRGQDQREKFIKECDDILKTINRKS